MTNRRFARSGYLERIAVPFLGQYVTLLVLLIFTTALIMTHLKLDSPLVSGDEYMYFANAREFPHNVAVAAYYPTLPRVNNILYLALGKFLWSHSSDPLFVARLIQPLMYLTIFFLLYIIASQFMLQASSVCVALLGFISAMSSYSAYFMPETMYHVIFYCLFVSTVLLLPQPILDAAVSGFLAALLMLTKPNGIAVAIGWMAAWLVCFITPRLVGVSRWACLSAVFIFPAATYASLVIVGSLCRGQFSANPSLFVGEYYQNMLSGQWQSPLSWSDLETVIVGNGTALCLMVGFPLACTLIALLKSTQPNKSDVTSSDHRHKTFVYTLILLVAVSACAVGMTIVFTAKIGGTELVRIHGRYYSFIVPLYLILMFSAAELFGTSLRVRSNLIATAGILGLAIVIFVQFYWRTTYKINPYDFPEIFVLADESRVTTTIVLIAAATFAAIAIVPRRAPLIFGAFFATLSLTSLIQTTRWQFDDNRLHGVWYREALAVRGLLSPASIDSGVVIGRDYDEIVVVLFGLRSISRDIILQQNSVVDESVVGPDAKWVLLQGEYNISLKNARIALQTDALKLIMLGSE